VFQLEASDIENDPTRASLSERAFSFFKKSSTKEFPLAPNMYNKNMKNGMPQGIDMGATAPQVTTR
jgi:hypothetical protein